MSDRASNGSQAALLTGAWSLRGSLSRKYVASVVTVVLLALLVAGVFQIWLSYQEHKTSLIRIQHEQAETAATKIGQFIKEIQTQMGWTTQLPWSAATLEQRRQEARRLLRQVPAITELVQVDSVGREQVRVSRLSMDVIGSGPDLAGEARFVEAMARKVYYGPVYFRGESEPYMVLSVAGTSRDAGVSVAEANLKFIWDVVSQIKVGKNGKAYVVDAGGRLIADPDISLVLRNTDLSHLPQVRAARVGGAALEQTQAAEDLQGRPVLAAYAAIVPLGWWVFVELPRAEAYAPVYASLVASSLVWLAGLALALFSSVLLARKLVTPIQALQAGAARIGTGALDHRIAIATGDELEALGNQFNSMAAQLQQSYATLERKVDERTHQLQLANLAKSRFLAAASHDLRQPLHALGLFVALLRTETDAAERGRVVTQINSAVRSMNDLFNALLDISRLDAGVLTRDIVDFPVAQLLERLETTFSEATREKRLRLRIAPTAAWVRSDFILLERVLLNLVSNAVRYTSKGGLVIGCRRRGAYLRIEVWDSGIGIPEDQRLNIFGEFYQIIGAERYHRPGLGLGLAIVDRLCRLLDHPIELTSTVGKGSRFTITVPLAVVQAKSVEPASSLPAAAVSATGKLVVMIDDDALVREGMRALMRAWGYRVVAADTEGAALAGLTECAQKPDLIISDYRLSGGKTGIEAIEHLRGACGAAIPAFLVTGDTAPELLRETSASGYHLLHKPVEPMTLRAMLSQMLKSTNSASGGVGRTPHDEVAISEVAAVPSRAQPRR